MLQTPCALRLVYGSSKMLHIWCKMSGPSSKMLRILCKMRRAGSKFQTLQILCGRSWLQNAANTTGNDAKTQQTHHKFNNQHPNSICTLVNVTLTIAYACQYTMWKMITQRICDFKQFYSERLFGTRSFQSKSNLKQWLITCQPVAHCFITYRACPRKATTFIARNLEDIGHSLQVYTSSECTS